MTFFNNKFPATPSRTWTRAHEQEAGIVDANMDSLFLILGRFVNLSSLFGTLLSSAIFLVVIVIILRRRRPIEPHLGSTYFDNTLDMLPPVRDAALSDEGNTDAAGRTASERQTCRTKWWHSWERFGCSATLTSPSSSSW